MNRRMYEAADWLQRLQASPGDEALAVEWFDWSQAEPGNLRAFERIQATWQAFDGFEGRKIDTPAVRRWPRFAVAAGIAVVATVAGWQFAGWDRSAPALTTDVAEHGSQLLADGSKVDLGARTRISTRFTSAQRRVEVVAGEAFFQVARDAGRPFVVRAGAVQITAVGTAFSVRRASDRTVVTVSEGAVRVAPDAIDAGHAVQAVAGDRVTFSAAARRLSVAQVDPALAIAWREGVLKYVDEPLAAVIDDVNRYSAHPIVLTDEGLRARLYTGTIYRDRIGDWLHALEKVFPLEVLERENREVVLAPL